MAMSDTMAKPKAPLSESELMDLRREYQLPEALGKVLALLLTEPYVTAKMIEERGITSVGKVAVNRLRKRMNAFGVNILSMRNMGYWLHNERKEQILTELAKRFEK